MRMRTVLPIVVCLGTLATLAGPAAARNEVIPLESPDWFVEGFGGYAYRETAAHTAKVGDQTQPLPGEEWLTWSAGLSATVPIALGFGVRARVQGAGTDYSDTFGTSLDFDDVTGGGELFWRDPTKGQIGAGYAYTRTSTDPDVASIRTHSVPVHASLYMPDLEPGTVDWNLGFRYDWLEVRMPGASRDQWAYEVFFTSTWYLNRFVSFEGGASYVRSLAPEQSDRVEGVFSLELLVPSGVRHYGVVEVFGAIGRDEDKDFGIFGDENRRTWQIGGRVSVHFPGVTSLVELNRAYR